MIDAVPFWCYGLFQPVEKCILSMIGTRRDCRVKQQNATTDISYLLTQRRALNESPGRISPPPHHIMPITFTEEPPLARTHPHPPLRQTRTRHPRRRAAPKIKSRSPRPTRRTKLS